MSDLLSLFQNYKDAKIAIYGLGQETERVLAQMGGRFNIAGLLDGFEEAGEMYGQPVIPLKQAVDMGVELIIVVARPGPCKVIAKRIGKVCEENHIALIDVRGKNLLNRSRVTYDFKNIEGVTRNQLLDRVGGKEAVSMDLFDTLIMRRVLLPDDVIELVYHRLLEKGIEIDEFCRKRLDSEKHLSKSSTPSLVEIYTYMCENHGISSILPSELAQIEWDVDYELVIPRRDMCSLMECVKESGKKIYIVTDTYYSRQQIIKLLAKCGISSYDDVVVSCEYGTGKSGNLFEILKAKPGGKACIHIGDDIAADVESAENHDIEAVHIYSGLELFEAVGYFGMWDYFDSLANRIKAGMFVSRIFNSPFQFETEKQKICIDNDFDLGYLLFAPVIADFTIWFEAQVKKYDLKNIWFCARDGYLLKRLYDELTGDDSSTYFLTSRTAAVRAGIRDKHDIDYVAEMKFSGTVKEQLAERFGMIVPDDSGDIYDYEDEILEKSKVCRKNYQKYIEGLHVVQGEIAFFDFVARGTTQMYVERLTDNHIKGLYFLQLEPDCMKNKGVDIVSFYTYEEKDGSAIFDNYFILEMILTSQMPSLDEFDEHGNPCYAMETRSVEDIGCCMNVQEGITDYFKTYIKICPKTARNPGKKIDEILLSLIHDICIEDKQFTDLKVEDLFFNRMTNIRDYI
jgi:FMN phosphatase YigB (HAD superfamily)